MNLKKPLLFLLFVALSCNNETELIESENKFNSKQESVARGLMHPTSQENDNFEKTLQWVSFISTRAIMNNPILRMEMYSILQGRNAVSIQELLGPNVNSNFKTKFIQELENYSGSNNSNQIVHNTLPGIQTPPRPIKTCEDNSQICSSPYPGDQIFDIFWNEILVDHCIELYFPKGFSPLISNVDNNSITSTAHPLNTSNFNDGFKHNTIITDDTDIYGVTTISTINTSYLNTPRDFVIVARPVRTISKCKYDEYNLNFLSFLP
ncbi:hypothetical protein BTO06_06400 [Tenacibaculum sp. SZ-18]|uniref:hypothetical protein n=1 Tax=Tenacibaculum sp. SZ-18 TaxID=754423 RepID=UPI000C2D2A8B|nr:hypothetical protein [Tenacibaculum sp. SZ-18]AUC14795.1 hypothetical protein BTO06_06400 [Tenacibaculum sp. SZ-18]